MAIHQAPPIAPISSEARGFFNVPTVPLLGYGTYDGGSSDEFTGVGILPGGSVVAVGYSMFLQGNQTPASVLNPGAIMVLTRPDDTMVVTASSTGLDGIALLSDEQGGSVLAKISADGSVVWLHGFDSAFNSPIPVSVATYGRIVVVGSAGIGSFASKILSDGSVEWTHTFTNGVSSGFNRMGFRSITTSPQGDYIVSGSYSQCVAGKSSSALVADIDASGSIVWYRCLGDGDSNSLSAVATATDGSIAAVGMSSTLDPSNGDPNGIFTGNALLARLTPNGGIG